MASNDAQTAIRRLTGTWRFQSFHIETAAGQVTYPFGRDAVG